MHLLRRGTRIQLFLRRGGPAHARADCETRSPPQDLVPVLLFYAILLPARPSEASVFPSLLLSFAPSSSAFLEDPFLAEQLRSRAKTYFITHIFHHTVRKQICCGTNPTARTRAFPFLLPRSRATDSLPRFLLVALGGKRHTCSGALVDGASQIALTVVVQLIL